MAATSLIVAARVTRIGARVGKSIDVFDAILQRIEFVLQ